MLSSPIPGPSGRVTHSFKRAEWQERKQLPDDTDEIKRVYHEEDRQLENFLKQFEFFGKSYTCRSLYERSRAVTLTFTREINADLFIVPGPRNRLGLWDRLFPHDLELALQNLPCSILITKGKTE